jgi:hypothetical protein
MDEVRIAAATMAIAAMVNTSGLVASSERGGLDSAVASFYITGHARHSSSDAGQQKLFNIAQ